VDLEKTLDVWLFLWVFLMVLIARRRFGGQTPTVGFPFAFLLVLSLEHWFGALIYSLPWHESDRYLYVEAGFIHSLYAVAAFCFGSLAVAPFLLRTFPYAWVRSQSYEPDPDLPLTYIVTGFVFYFLLAPILVHVASFRTLVYSGWNLLVAGVCLGCWQAWANGDKKKMYRWMFFALVAPIFTMITNGFLGVGTNSLMTVLCFVSVFYRPRARVFVGAILFLYLGVSFFVNYMEHRTELRESAWYGKPVTERAKIILKMVKNFELINLRKPAHIRHIDGRLNQNYLLGASIDHLENGYEEYAGGETIINSFSAVVPRILWPAKPVVLGGSGIAAKYTGLDFSDDVSVGVGLIMELYINFGATGIIIGFMFFGVIMTLIDVACAYRIRDGDWQGFTYLFLPMLSFIGSSSFAQVMLTIASSVVFCILVNKYILPYI
jgi:hypothetical protein